MDKDPQGVISRKGLQIFLAELLGMVILIYIGILGCNEASFGFALVLAAQTFGHISGAHFNPSVTIAALIFGKIKWNFVPVYLMAQFVGSFLAYTLFYLTQYFIADFKTNSCPTYVFDDYSLAQGVMVEAIATGMLVLVCCSSWDTKNSSNDGAGSLKVGFCLYGLIVATKNITGASFNIARTMPVAIIRNEWDDHWVYWVGPLLGACTASLIYRFALLKRPWQEEY